MAKVNDEEKLVRIVKGIVIGLVVAAVISFLLLSAGVFNLSVTDPYRYESNYSKLSSSEKNMVRSMKKTGEVQSKVVGTRRSVGGNGKFIDEVNKNHQSDKKK
jgi:hypothetical protein